MTRSSHRSQRWAWSGTERAWNLLALVLLVAFVALTIGPVLVGRGVLLDVGILTRFMPWRVGGVYEHANFCRGDTIDGVMPQIAAIRDGLRHGDVTTWSPYTIGGAPLASLPNDGVLNPVSWPYFVLPLWLAPAFVKLMQFVVGVGGMVAFLGRHGVRRGSAVIAGIVFVSSGFMVMWTNWPQVVVGCFIPALFWALDRAVVERRARDIAIVGMVVACMLLGGFPAVTLYALTLGGIYVLVRALRLGRLGARSRTLRGLVVAGLGVVLGVALSAVQLLPFIRDLAALRLGDRPAGGAKEVDQFLTVMAPEIHGTCIGGAAYGPSNPIELIAFLGAAAVVLVLCAVALRLPGPRPRPRPVLLALFCLGVVVLIWVGREPLHLLQQLPGYSSNSIGRASSVFGFLGAALAGFGLDRLLTRARSSERLARSPRNILVSAVVIAAVVVFTAWAFVDAYTHSERDHQLPLFREALALPGVILVLALAGVAASLLLRGRWRMLGPLVLAVVVVTQSTLFVRDLLPASQRSDFYPVTAGHRFLQQHLGHDRYVGGSFWGYPATSTYYGLNTPVGHGFHSLRWLELLEAISPDIRLSPTFTAFPDSVPTAEVGNMPLLDQLAVRYFATAPDDVVGHPVPSMAVHNSDSKVPVGARRHATCTVKGGPLRGIEVRVAGPRELPQHPLPVAHVRVTTPDGLVVAGARALDMRVLRNTYPMRIGVMGEDLPVGGRFDVRVWITGTGKPTEFRGDGSHLRCGAVRPRAGDGLRLVHADSGTLIYERPSALPRIRWAGTSEVVTSADTRVSMLERGVPDDTVLLESEALPAARGSHAEVHVVRDEPERIEATVHADGQGYLVVADALVRIGWSATVDGRPVDLVQGNHAFGAVPVGPGSHRVVLHYTAPGMRTGAMVSAGAAGVTVLLIVAPYLVRRRRRPDEPDDVAEEPVPEPDAETMGGPRRRG